MEQGKEIKENCSGTQNFDICYCKPFDRCYKSFISGRENEH